MEWVKQIIAELQKAGVEIDTPTINYARLDSVGFQFVDEQHPNSEFDESIIVHRDIFEKRPQQVVSRIKSILGLNLSTIFARETYVTELSKKKAAKFIEDNHLLGFPGGKTFLGLRDDTELVAVAVFSKVLYMKHENPPYHSVELVRYCSLMDTTVVGGMDKLIKAYIKEHEVDDVVTYVDKEFLPLGPPLKGEDVYRTSYEKLGFEVVGETEPLTFKVNKLTWERELVRDALPQIDFSASIFPPPKGEGYYFVKNQGNLKLRLKVKK